MELSQLEAFINAADCGSFSRAAELLHVAQPSISRLSARNSTSPRGALISRSRKPVQDAGPAISAVAGIHLSTSPLWARVGFVRARSAW